jgi:hypothetical protein
MRQALSVTSFTPCYAIIFAAPHHETPNMAVDKPPPAQPVHASSAPLQGAPPPHQQAPPQVVYVDRPQPPPQQVVYASQPPPQVVYVERPVAYAPSPGGAFIRGAIVGSALRGSRMQRRRRC